MRVAGRREWLRSFEAKGLIQFFSAQGDPNRKNEHGARSFFGLLELNLTMTFSISMGLFHQFDQFDFFLFGGGFLPCSGATLEVQGRHSQEKSRNVQKILEIRSCKDI